MKQVIVMRTDLNMSVGKMCAQASHASVRSMFNATEQEKLDWEINGEKKAVLKTEGRESLIAIVEKAILAGLPCFIVADKGLTEVPQGTFTCLSIGPADDSKIDEITGHLKLL